ncbi:15845_t:CDS:2 [Funneliformis caledonium]|uniref:15845_t:CDS:1 n=1 Tax=Funneliformis caledonium TaxID=1117310 RepID=A0A9N9I0A7_9GLOM|nr:15845_t:CDS:2 [Funneliformis caledonium]
MNLEENLEYENLEEDLSDKNETFCSEYENYSEYKSLSNVKNNESLFELDFNIFTNTKLLAQQNILKDDDQGDISDVGKAIGF